MASLTMTFNTKIEKPHGSTNDSFLGALLGVPTMVQGVRIGV